VNFEELSIWLNVGIFAVAAIAVWVAGTKLAQFADRIAEATGWGREMLGILLLGGVTSLPELAVATTATFRGVPALSIGDVLGSAAVNLVVLAIADAVSGRRALTSVQGSPSVILQGLLGILLLSIAAMPAITGDRSVLGAGISSWVMLAVYIGGIRLLASSNAPRAWHVSHEAKDESPAPQAEQGAEDESTRPLFLKTIAAGTVIVFAGFLLARTGESLAEQSGLGTSFFGAVFLAFATSLPEWSTVIAAVRLRRYEMAISDIFGTNLFNVTIIVAVDFLHPGGPILLETGRTAAFGAMLALALTVFFMVGLLERRDRTVLRMGWDSMAVIFGYCGGVAVLHALS
jgi:cation:H+ antiporter